MNIQIDYSQLQMIPYVAAGNRTPVLCLDFTQESHNDEPSLIRSSLENDLQFRTIIAERGKLIKADSIMIYYRTNHESYEFAMFVGEPNAPLTSAFSEMCGNGIRSLALHIVLEEKNAVQRQKYLSEGIKIWTCAGIMTVKISDFDISRKTGIFEVPLGPFNTRSTYGFNGISSGEPHAVMILDEENLRKLCDQYNLGDTSDCMQTLRQIASLLGAQHTFDYKKYPAGINFNLALIRDNQIIMATHERNLALNRSECITQFKQNGICSCVTQACGTGGSAVANYVVINGHLEQNSINTIHFGGQIQYHIDDNQTYMLGDARRLSN